MPMQIPQWQMFYWRELNWTVAGLESQLKVSAPPCAWVDLWVWHNFITASPSFLSRNSTSECHWLYFHFLDWFGVFLPWGRVHNFWWKHSLDSFNTNGIQFALLEPHCSLEGFLCRDLHVWLRKNAWLSISQQEDNICMFGSDSLQK